MGKANQILKRLDGLAGLTSEKGVAIWLERLAFCSLVLMTVSAPHSIAATQTAWLLGMIFWISRYFVSPRPKFIRTSLFTPFLLFFAWTVLTAIFSYAPDISIAKLKGVSLILIFFFSLNNLKTPRSIRFVAVALLFSCMVNVFWVPIERLIGRGIEIREIKTENPLDMKKGDVLVSIDGQPINTPKDIIRKLEQNGEIKILTQRFDSFWYQRVIKTALLKGNSDLQKLGISSWKRSRNWRSSGFYGHYATYAEVMQLIASLAFGLFIASFNSKLRQSETPQLSKKKNSPDDKGKGFSALVKSIYLYCSRPWFLLFVTTMMALALLLTVTRAPQAAFIVSCVFIALLGGSRKVLKVFGIAIIPLIIAGLYGLHQSRNVGFLDTNDGSIVWRKVVYKEGFNLWSENIRNLTLGVGMDSAKRYKQEWKLFADGKLPPGHFHSTPLQLVVERGFPALIFWLIILGIYIRIGFVVLKTTALSNWLDHGIVLGCMGGTLGFFISGLVHYNLGDSEVAMVFFLLMAFVVRIQSVNSPEISKG